MTNTPRQMQIFVSHSSADKLACDALVAALREAGADVWYDEHDLGVGVLRREIMKELAARPVTLILLSSAAFTSAWVQDECEWAYNLYRRKTERLILPIVVGQYKSDDFDTLLYLESMKRVEGPQNTPYPLAEIITRTLSLLALMAPEKTLEQESPQHGEALADLLIHGKALAAQTRYVDALPFFRSATMTNPHSIQAWSGLEFTLNNLQRFGEAQSAHEEAATLALSMGRQLSLAQDYTGLRLDRYEVIKQLAHGGNAWVYQAHDQMLDCPVAIKAIPNDVEESEDFVARFNREIEIARALSHPHIVEILDSGETEEIVYFAMPLLGGGSLQERLVKSTQLPVELAALYAAQMAHALHYAHENGVIHRDVKPSNMLFDHKNRNHLFLVDFGTAMIQGIRGMTKNGIAIGTPEYMSPEQSFGYELDSRSDIYSLGIVLYEMLAGRPPFKGQGPVAIMYQHVHVAPAYVRGYNPQVPKDLCHVIETALQKNRDERYATAEEFAQALHPFMGQFTEVRITVSGDQSSTSVHESRPSGHEPPSQADEHSVSK
jgi:hypothetical protein